MMVQTKMLRPDHADTIAKIDAVIINLRTNRTGEAMRLLVDWRDLLALDAQHHAALYDQRNEQLE